jgi:hypothetical protein
MRELLQSPEQAAVKPIWCALSNLDTAAGVGAESAAHPVAADARRELDVSVEMDELGN